MYSTHNEGKSVLAERFVGTSKNKVYKHMTAVSKISINIDKLNNIVNKCNNIYHKTIKMNPTDVKSGTYISFDVGSNDEDRKRKVCDH